MDSDRLVTFALGAAAGVAAAHLFQPSFCAAKGAKESLPDQPARFAAQKAANDTRALAIEQHFEQALLAGKRVLVTGSNRGIGLAIVREAVACGASVVAACRKASPELREAGVEQIVEGVDVTKTSTMAALVTALSGKPVDVLINNAGYFMVERESILSKTMDYDEELKMIDICAVGMLRVTQAVFDAGLLRAGAKVAMITSQGGSIAWRDVQCPEGGDYGHHMSKAAANMAGKLCANELKAKGIPVSILHPGFNRTGMTAKYQHIWDVEGAVDASVGAKRVLHEINLMTMDNTGTFINCEDGLVIPW
eukprot:g5920.t1